MKSPTFGGAFGGVLPQQGKRISQKVGLGLSRAEKRRGREGEGKELLSPGAVKQRRPGDSPWVGRGQAACLPEDYSPPTRVKPRADRDNKRK